MSSIHYSPTSPMTTKTALRGNYAFVSNVNSTHVDLNPAKILQPKTIKKNECIHYSPTSPKDHTKTQLRGDYAFICNVNSIHVDLNPAKIVQPTKKTF